MPALVVALLERFRVVGLYHKAGSIAFCDGPVFRDGMSMICVTHELNFARNVAHRIIFMDQGRIIEDQAPDDFFNNPKSQRAKLFLDQILSH